jgi:surface antigen
VENEWNIIKQERKGYVVKVTPFLISMSTSETSFFCKVATFFGLDFSIFYGTV